MQQSREAFRNWAIETCEDNKHKQRFVSVLQDNEIYDPKYYGPRTASNPFPRLLDKYNSTLEELYPCDLPNGSYPEAQVDIVAVHGLHGNPQNTWTSKNGIMWLRDLLPRYINATEQGQLPGLRILTFGYDADARASSRWRHIPEQATDLVRLISSVRRGQTQKRPLVLIGHSQGGLLIKQALLNAEAAEFHPNPAAPDFDRQEMQNIFQCLLGVIFLGTPHNGSKSLLTYTKFCSWFAHKERIEFLKWVPPPVEEQNQLDQAKELEKLNKAFYESWYNRWIPGDDPNPRLGKPLWIHNYSETERIGTLWKKVGFMVVDQECATLRQPFSSVMFHTMPLEGEDHLSICKYEDATNPNFNHILNSLIRMTACIRRPEPEDLTTIQGYEDLRLGLNTPQAYTAFNQVQHEHGAARFSHEAPLQFDTDAWASSSTLPPGSQHINTWSNYDYHTPDDR